MVIRSLKLSSLFHPSVGGGRGGGGGLVCSILHHFDGKAHLTRGGLLFLSDNLPLGCDYCWKGDVNSCSVISLMQCILIGVLFLGFQDLGCQDYLHWTYCSGRGTIATHHPCNSISQ